MAELKNFKAFIKHQKDELKNAKVTSEKVGEVEKMGENARSASNQLRTLKREDKDNILKKIVGLLESNKSTILEANRADLKNFDDLQAKEKETLEDGKAPKYTAALKSRLDLFGNDEKYFKSMIDSINSVIGLEEITGTKVDERTLKSGIKLSEQFVALGVMFMIYESRPNVTADAAALNIKAGNACILKGGKEAIKSNMAIANCIKEAFKAAGFGHLEKVVQIVRHTDRWITGAFLNMDDYVDFVVPRGGKGLNSVVSRESKVPVIYHLDGTCHIYVDKDADLKKAVAIILNAKTQSYGTCNTVESLILHSSISDKLLKLLCPYLRQADRKGQEGGIDGKGIVIRTNDSLADHLKSVQGYPEMLVEVIKDKAEYSKEHLSPTLTLLTVESKENAVEHIEEYGSHHTDAIITEDKNTAKYFLDAVNSASVYHNMSTRFADGFEYGLGAEIGISTSKMNPRGPVGLKGLTSQKWIGEGDAETGSIRGGFGSLEQFKIKSLDDIGEVN